MCIDLHTHSLYSDGTCAPDELVALASRIGLCALALTDHDTMEGVAESQALGRKAGIRVISGVEISATLRQHVLHILGYGIDPGDEDFRRWLQPLQEGRQRRNMAILRNLQGMGIRIDQEELERVSPQGQSGRPHIARLLVEKGVVDSADAAFHQYLGRGKPAWAPRFSYSAVEAITRVHRAGGLAVLAHPGQLDPSLRLQGILIAELSRKGLDGVEAWYPSHTKKTRKRLQALASRHGLIVTGGSDFHGANKPTIRLAGDNPAFCPPDALLEDLQARLSRECC